MVTSLAGAMPVAHAGHGGALEALQWLLPVLVLTVGGGSYVAAVLAYGRRRAHRWDGWRTASWLTGTALVALALSPVLAAGAEDARAHMVQHLLLGMLGPLALVMAAPVSLVLGATPPSVGRGVGVVLRSRPVHVLGHPVIAAVLNVGGMYALYLTPVYAASLDHGALHHLVHVHFLIAGYLFTWSIAGPDPAPRRPRLATRVTVLVLAAGAHSYLGKLLFSRAGELPPGAGHSAAEIESAAQLMYYGGDLAELLLAAALFATWYRRAGARLGRPPVSVCDRATPGAPGRGQ